MFDWMVWTTPVAVFFSCVALMLVGMTALELRVPTVLRKGFLPIATTRGDRMFIGLLVAAYLNLLWVGISGWVGTSLGLSEDPSIWYSFVLSMAVLGLILRRG